MLLPAGTRLGVYDILGPLGAGGMGEVYKAHDSRLDRTVAVKILPPHVAADATLKQRFEREAKALAALSHPHICAVFDVGQAHTDHGDLDFLVMEHLEGETLAQRLARGALPLTDALRYGIQIADALDKAHRKGVVHRDLKPGNIMVTSGGVKLLDFGLAKLQAAPGRAVDLTAAPTVTSPLTGAGSIVGTFQYMAPEQIEGREADARTDIFAFGAVLFEMLTGSRAFEGTTQAGLIAAILEREPKSLSSVQPTAPPALDQLVKTCLEKQAENRWQGAADIGRQLKWILDGGSQPSAAAQVPANVAPRTRRMWPLVAAAVTLVALAGAGFVGWSLTRPAPATVSRLLLAQSTETPFVTVGGVDVLLTPDGQRIVYLGRRAGGFALYVRELAELESRMIAGTELPDNFAVSNPFLSWDGTSVVFRSPGKGIFRVPLSGGTPLKLADDSPRFLGGAWGPDDTIVVSLADGLYRANATGGTTLERLTAPGPPRVLFINPSMLPDGKAVLFHMTDLQQRTSSVAVFELGTREHKILIEGGSEAKYMAPGYMVFARETTLMAAPFDAGSRTLTGPAVTVQPDVNHPALLSATDYSVSGNGTLIYVPSTTQVGAGAPVWVDRSGRPAGPVVSGQVVAPVEIRLSPDARRLLVSGGRPQDRDLWVYDLAGRPPIPLADRGDNVAPLWSPDGARVVFASNRDGTYDFYSLPADGGTSDPTRFPVGGPRLASGINLRVPESWMPDGRLVFVYDQAAAQSGDVLIASSGTSVPEPLIKTEYSESSSAVSPDGRWVAYRSDRTGRGEIWVRALTAGAPARVSQNGGSEPVWSRDSRQLFYLEGNKMMAVGVKPGGTGFTFDAAVMLFDQPYFHVGGRSYDVAPDGRFAMITLAGGPSPSQDPRGIVVVQNWVEELKRLVPRN